MIVEEYKYGDATIRIHDDFITSKEESDEILRRVADNALKHLIAYNRVKSEEETA